MKVSYRALMVATVLVVPVALGGCYYGPRGGYYRSAPYGDYYSAPRYYGPGYDADDGDWRRHEWAEHERAEQRDRDHWRTPDDN